ncbi:MAG: hypothetical protein L0Y71_23125 [Gemmataceae bacterium]|nr:hypothetical protein [Gemmataceae bacterium]
MQQVRWSRGGHFGLAVAALSVVALLTSLSGAPGQQLSRGEDELAFRGMSFTFREKTLAGHESASEQTLELASRYYVLRVTSVEALADIPKRMHGVHMEFEVMAKNVAKNFNTNREIVRKFTPHMLKRFKEVFALDFKSNSLAIVNGALLLPHFAKFRHDDVGDYLAELIADEKTHDAIRVHAADGMLEYFPIKAFTKFSSQSDKAIQERKTRDARRVDALLKFVNRPMPPVADAEQFEALRFVRRKAVIALAATGVPAVTAYKGKLEGPVAGGLIKILSKKVQPPPSLSERLEAAIGVCYFTKYVEEYDPKIGLFLVGEALDDIFAEYQRDFANIAQKPKDRKPTYLPWKIQSKRLEHAMKELMDNTRGTPVAADAQTLANMALPMLNAIGRSEQLERTLDFQAAVRKMRPKGKTLFKNEKGSMLDVDWEAAAPAPEK